MKPKAMGPTLADWPLRLKALRPWTKTALFRVSAALSHHIMGLLFFFLSTHVIIAVAMVWKVKAM